MNKHLKIYFSSSLFFGFFSPRAKYTRIRFKNVDSSPADFGSGLISCCLRFAWAWRSPRLVLVGRSSSRLAMVSCRHSTLRPRARPKQRLPVSKAQRWLASCSRHVLLSENKLGWSSTDTVPMRLCPSQHQLRTAVSRMEGRGMEWKTFCLAWRPLGYIVVSLIRGFICLREWTLLVAAISSTTPRDANLSK